MASLNILLFIASLLQLTSCQQSIGTLCILRSSTSEPVEDCNDFSLEQLPDLPNPDEITSLKVMEVDEPLLNPELFASFVNLKELVIQNNNFEHLTGPFPKLQQLKKLVISGNSLQSIYWKNDSLPVKRRGLPPVSTENTKNRNRIKLLTDDAAEALNGEHNTEILTWLFNDNENFFLDEALEELLEASAKKAGMKNRFRNVDAKTNGFVNLKQLKFLNISHNKITDLRMDLKFILPNLEEVDLAGNPWTCSEDLTWVQTWSVFKYGSNETHCGPGVAVLNGVSLSRGLDLVQKLDLQCPNKCLCKLDRVPKSEELAPAVIVNCSGLGLTRLPEQLPTDTVLTLDMRNNSVSDLRPIASSPFYRHLNKLFLDNNNISSFAGLEGSAWLSNIHALSLQGNKLSHIPTYALEDALKSESGAAIWLGNNPWTCDCSTVPDMQTFLAKYTKNVKDVGSMRCADVQEDPNSLRKVNEVSLESVCLEESDGAMEILNLVNVVLGLMTILLVGNLLYDYYQFKKTGKVPWIVTKMP